MTTYEKYLQWKSEQTSKAPSIKAFCEWLDLPEMVREDPHGKIARSLEPYVCELCVYNEVCIIGNPLNNYCNRNNAINEYYYAKPD